jgi:gamma-glutamyltranspeptidase / glutathione hydrolase
MHRRSFLVAVTLLVSPCFAQTRRPDPPVRQPVRGTHGAVAAGSDWATNAGMRLYDQGGTAVDAGVATMFAASVTELSHFGMGGEAPILIRTKAGKVYSIFRKRQVQLGDITFRESGETHLKGIIPDAGIMPALVPGMVDAGLVALREFGTKSFAQVIAPAIELADGYALDDMRARSFAGAQPFLELWPTSKAHFMPNGHTPAVGEIFRQPDLAKTLRAMVAAEKKALASGAKREAAIDAVRDYFYRGEVARKIDAFSKANGGLLRYEDMAAFKLAPEEPLSTTFRGLIVYKPGFWSQGPAMLEGLNIIEGFDGKMALNSADYLHRQAEAMKLAYADRDTYYADPKFSKLNVSSLLTKEYAAERRKLIGPRASMEFRPGAIDGKTGRHPALSEMASYKIDDVLMAHDTTCVDTMDNEGIVFSATPSGAWMPSVIAGDTGIPLTQRAQSFVLIPGHPNELAGGKRPRVTLSPTLVTQADGKPFLALSTPGADNQEQSLIQVMMNVIDYGMNAQNAIENPRYQTRHLVASLDEHAWSVGDLMLDERIPQSVAMELLSRGHKVQIMSRYNNGAAPVMIKLLPGGIIEAGADPYYNRSARAR